MATERLSHVSMIVAQAKHRVIGYQNRMQWHVPEDLRFFKAQTVNKTVIMGHNTLLSLGRTLPKRHNVVISRVPAETLASYGTMTLVPNFEAALDLARQSETEVMIIGGGQTYRDFLPYASRIYLTELDLEVEGDVTFPELDPHTWVRTHLETLAPTPARPFAVHFYQYDLRD